jgi:RNA polymerase sigma-70 factor (ECF subfamily)
MTVRSDADLVRDARSGDAASLGLLLDHHRAGMRAVAISLLGWGPDADDVVQDAMLVALRRLGDLRDAAAAGPWLKAITRNVARMRLRSAGREVALGPHLPDPPSSGLTPEQVVDGHALRDWVWAAVETLTEPLQVVVLLRYFSDTTSYDQIAAACEVPVGTVRSRLHEARRQLTGHLLAASTAAHADVGARTAGRRREVEDLLGSAHRGEFRPTLAALAGPDLLLIGPQGQRARGYDLLVSIMDSDLAAGVRQRPVRVTAGRHVTILECDFVNPAWDPWHCPPGVLWLMRLDGGRIDQIRLYHPAAPGG